MEKTKRFCGCYRETSCRAYLHRENGSAGQESGKEVTQMTEQEYKAQIASLQQQIADLKKENAELKVELYELRKKMDGECVNEVDECEREEEVNG